jgi:hypothetical protein
MEYIWKSGFPDRGVEPQDVGERLEELRERADGTLLPEDVIADARHRRSPLHKFFEWDDTEAAHQHRLEQARSLIRAVVVILPQKPTTPVRAFVSIRQEGDKERSYTSTVAAMSDPRLRAQVLASAKAEIVAWHQRYKQLEEFSQLFQEIDAQLRLMVSP